MPLTALLKTLNAQIRVLAENSCKIYDFDNPEWFIDDIFYDYELDKLMFKCKEECKDD